MKIVKFDKPGLPGVLKVLDSGIPEPKDNEVLIRNLAIGVNRPDLLQREGLYPAPKGHSDILGLEVSGIIEKIGKDVKKFNIGDKVCSLLDGGGYAEFSVAKENQTIKFPENLTFEEAAGIPECFMTCWSNLIIRGKIQKGEKVLIHGGSSGIGTTAIQILSLFNCKIYTTVGTEKKKKFCEKLGANFVMNYNKDDFYELVKKETENSGVNLIFDMVGGDYIQKNIDLLSNDGRLINIAFQKGHKVNINMMRVMLKRLTITGSTLRIRDELFKNRIINDLENKIFPEILKGKIKPVIDSVFKIDDVVKAHKRLYSKEHIGKIILKT